MGHKRLITAVLRRGMKLAKKLSPERAKNIESLLIELRATKECCRCGHCLFGMLVEMSIPVGLQKRMSLILIACKNCGNISFHSTEILGLDGT